VAGGVETDRVERVIADLVKYKVIQPGSITPADVVDTDLTPKG
jgi:hypothetical protein